MNTTNYTLLFCISLTITYLAARSGRLNLLAVTISGLFLNTLTFSMYAMERQHFWDKAALTGIQLSLIFTLLSVAMACAFRVLETMEHSERRVEFIPAFVHILLDQ